MPHPSTDVLVRSPAAAAAAASALLLMPRKRELWLRVDDRRRERAQARARGPAADGAVHGGCQEVVLGVGGRGMSGARSGEWRMTSGLGAVGLVIWLGIVG